MIWDRMMVNMILRKNIFSALKRLWAMVDRGEVVMEKIKRNKTRIAMLGLLAIVLIGKNIK